MQSRLLKVGTTPVWLNCCQFVFWWTQFHMKTDVSNILPQIYDKHDDSNFLLRFKIHIIKVIAHKIYFMFYIYIYLLYFLLTPGPVGYWACVQLSQREGDIHGHQNLILTPLSRQSRLN